MLAVLARMADAENRDAVVDDGVRDHVLNLGYGDGPQAAATHRPADRGRPSDKVGFFNKQGVDTFGIGLAPVGIERENTRKIAPRGIQPFERHYSAALAR